MISAPNSLGSVKYPVIADAAAVSVLTRYTPALIVPHLPLKFLLNVLSEIPSVFGACPIPMQGPQAASNNLAPAAINFANAPFSEIIFIILLEPGDNTRLTSG